jgi:hypothetical protein
MKKNEMSGVCGVYGAEEMCLWGFASLKVRDYLENQGFDGRIILK